MITLNVGAKILHTALSNFEDWPSGPKLVLGLSFSIIFRAFSELIYEKEKARWHLGPKNEPKGGLFEKLDFGQNFRKILIMVKIYKKFQFCCQFSKISILVEIFEGGRNIWQFSTLITILENLDFCKMFKNHDFGKNLRKSWLW